ncbi:MAG TPA: wax ester/triacylglycerol synthase family O-acyltransferase [Myxococcota bacterium]|nr:wax ester/triacylglycerol synthase family O-acyltransferase [Myxococcota bacterium]
MRRLRAIDAAFLYAETDAAPMHAAALQVFEPAPGGEDFFRSFRAQLRERLALLPYLHEHLHETPLGLDHPVWVADTRVDLARHLRLDRLSPPGSLAQLSRLAEQLYPPLLDRSRPLWEYTVIEGLERGRVALFGKAHHACLDGMAVQATLETMFSRTPGASLAPRVHEQHDREPGAITLLRDAFAHLGEQPERSLRALPDLARAARSLVERAWERRAGPSTPHTRFNVPVSAERRFEVASVSLERIRAIARAEHVSVNDAVMAACGGALRSYLAERRELPREPLVAFAPVSLRPRGDTSPGNQVFGMLSSLATDVDDPLQRLRAVHASARDAKALVDELRPVAPSDFAFPGAAAVIPALVHLVMALHIPERAPFCNLVISNVPGVPHPVYMRGARMIAEYPMSIVTNGVALNITVMGVEDALDVGLVACARAVPDLDALRDALVESFRELEKATAPREAIRA